MFDQKLPACRKCAFYRQPFVPPEGSRRAEVVFCGDSPWRTEAERHRPFVGPAGQIYNALLESAGLERREVYTTNAVKCQPEALGQVFPRGVVDLCTELYLKKELARIKPRLVVPMGNAALKALKVKESITQARGLVKEHTIDDETYTILPVFHPCVTGDTLIDCPRDLQKYPDGIPIKDLVGKKPWTYAWSVKRERFVVRRALSVKCTGRDKEVWKLRYGWQDVFGHTFFGELRATPHHKILLESGKYKYLAHLQPGDQLVPLTRWYHHGNKHSHLFLRGHRGSDAPEHRFVYAEVHGPIQKGRAWHIHHVDENSINNSPGNLQQISASAHKKLHPAVWTETAKRRISKAKMGNTDNLGQVRNAQALENQRQGMRKFWANLSDEEYERYAAISTQNLALTDTHRLNHVVISVEPDGYEDVYDMQVAGVHNFVANGIVVHNSFLLRKPAYTPYSEQDFQSIQYFLTHNHQRPDNADLDYQAVITPGQIRDFFRAFVKAKYISCDVETTGLDYRSDTLLSIQFSFKSKSGYCLPLYKLPYAEHGGITTTPLMHQDTRIPGVEGHPLAHLREFFYDPDKTFFFHNGKFDLRMLHQFFLKTLGSGLQVDSINWMDTMAMYGLLNENTSQSLKEIAKMHTDLRYTSKELASVKGGQLKKVSLNDMVMYGVKDVDATRRLAQQFTRELHDQNLWDIYNEHDASDMKVANILYKMELFGAPIDTSKIAQLETFMEERLSYYHRRMQKRVGREFNPNSSDQLATVLFEDLRFPTSKKTAGGKFSTDKEVISALMVQYPRNKFLRYFRMHRDYTSIEKTFVKGFLKKLDKDGRLHPDFGFTRTVSGRVVCYNPNLANIPRDREFEEGVFVSIRNLFAVPNTHKIVYADASQIEFKTAAVLSRDTKIIKALFEDKADFHDLVARALYPKYEETFNRYLEVKNQLQQKMTSKLRAKLEDEAMSCEIILKVGRTRSKNFNFGRIYGAQLPTLAAALGTTVEKVEPYIRRLSRRYPKFEDFLTDIPRRAIQDGELINPYMRRRRFPPTLDERVESEQARQGGNFLPQSSAAYVIRAALVRIATSFERIGMSSYPFNIVYDSIIVESPNDEVRDAQKIMVQEMLRPVPELFNHSFAIECGIGQSWQSAEKAARKIYTLKEFVAVAEF